MLDRALALGFDAVATGHYAQLRDRRRRADRDAPRGRHGQGPVLRARRARPRSSSRTRCSRSATPPRPRSAREAERRGLAVADKPDSHDICFIADGDTAGWLAREARRRRQPAGRSSTTRRRGARRARGRLRASRSASARGCGIGTPGRRRQAALRARHRAGLRHRHGRARASGSRSTGIDGDQAALVRRGARRRRSTCTVQLRAHGDEHRRGRHASTATRVDDRAARPGVAASRPGRPPWSTTAPGSSARPPSPPPDARAGLSHARDRCSPPASGRCRATRLRRGAAHRPRRAARPAAPARAAGARRARRHDRPRRSPCVAGLGADLQPAGWRLTDAPGVDHRRARSLLGAGPRRRSRSWPRATTGAVQDPGRRAVDAGRDRREAARRQGARRPRRPPRARPGARRGRCASTSPTCGAGCPGADAGRPGRRAGAAGRAGRQGADRVRLRPAPHRCTRPAASSALEWVFAAVRGRAPSPVAHCCAADGPSALLTRRRRGRRLGRPRPARRRGDDDAGGAPRGRAGRCPRGGAVDRPRDAADRTRASPSGCCGGSTCSAWTRRVRRRCAHTGLRAGRRGRPTGPARRCTSCSRSRYASRREPCRTGRRPLRRAAAPGPPAALRLPARDRRRAGRAGRCRRGPTLDPEVRGARVPRRGPPAGVLRLRGRHPGRRVRRRRRHRVGRRHLGAARRPTTPAGRSRAASCTSTCTARSCAGRFVLVRTGTAERQGEWLLLHKHDEYAVDGWDAEDHPRSVLSGRTNDEVQGRPGPAVALGPAGRPASVAAARGDRAGRPTTSCAALDALRRAGHVARLRPRAAGHQPRQGAVPGPAAARSRSPSGTCSGTRAQIAPTLLPYLTGRRAEHAPLPERRRHQGLLAQGAARPRARSGCRAGTTRRPTRARRSTYLVVDEPAALVWAANFGALEWHAWTSRVDEPHRPTYALIDLDPGERTTWEDLLMLARLHRTAFEHLGVVGPAEGHRPARHPDLGARSRRARLRRDPRVGGAAVADRRRGRPRAGQLEVAGQRPRRAWPGSTTPRTRSTRPWSRRTARGPRRARRCRRRSTGTSSTTRAAPGRLHHAHRRSTGSPSGATCSATSWPRSRTCRRSAEPDDAGTTTPGRAGWDGEAGTATQTATPSGASSVARSSCRAFRNTRATRVPSQIIPAPVRNAWSRPR